MRVLVLHGPNLNLLGTRETGIYGAATLSEIDRQIHAFAKQQGVEVETFQSNSEGVLVDRIQEAVEGRYDAIVLNAAALTHTSIAIRDALLAVKVPAVEVHLSNIFGREAFRQTSKISDIVIGQVAGFGPQSYLLGLLGAIRYVENRSNPAEETTSDQAGPLTTGVKRSR
ncbi:MAG: type II 3-dehydroquinate dehydratase [Nitrospiria bacterium]